MYFSSEISSSKNNEFITSAKLATALSLQPWSDLGLRKATKMENNDHHAIIAQSTMIERVTAVIERRMVAVIRAKRGQAASLYLDKGNDPRQDVGLHPQLYRELKDYVSQISSMYRGVKYHSFMHATHVTISLDRMITIMLNNHKIPDSFKNENRQNDRSFDCVNSGASHPVNSCFGLYNDPVAHLCLVFAALVHDVDHTGICNSDLVKEGSELSILYNNLSIAEQHSLAIAFSTLFEPSYEALRDAVFPASEDYLKFMDVVTELVIYTDLGSPKIKDYRQSWERLFGDRNINCTHMCHADDERKSLIMVLMLQAADVAHNIQGWDNFLLWNHRLYDELLCSYLQGRGDNPATNWYRGQISFFDGYIIPLAKKLYQCGIFLRNGDDFLMCVQNNRQRWLLEGEAITKLIINTRSCKREASMDSDDDSCTGISYESCSNNSIRADETD